MTFYNRIESVRGIAIDLTNGRKWRGASDKAAVFDALDAARREYMRLSDENAKLREQIHWLKKGDILHVLTDQEYIDQCERERLMQVSIDALDNENAKLRELLSEIAKLVTNPYGGCLRPGCAHGCPHHLECDEELHTCFYVDRMRELGVDE